MKLLKRLMAAGGAAGLLVGLGATPAFAVTQFSGSIAADCINSGQHQTITVDSALDALVHIEVTIGGNTANDGTAHGTGPVNANGTFSDEWRVDAGLQRQRGAAAETAGRFDHHAPRNHPSGGSGRRGRYDHHDARDRGRRPDDHSQPESGSRPDPTGPAPDGKATKSFECALAGNRPAGRVRRHGRRTRPATTQLIPGGGATPRGSLARGASIVIAVGVTLLVAGIPASVIGRPPIQRVAPSKTILATASTTPSPSASPTASAPEQAAADKAQRNAAAVVAAAAPPTPVTARISIPRIGIRNAPVYDRGTDSRGNMLIAPGYSVTHYAFSAAFGAGNAVIYGHDDIQGSIFGHLYDLRPGDTVRITVGAEIQNYRATVHQIGAPTALSVLSPTRDARLTMLTCWPYNVDTQRWIVTAVKT